jgi:hypothetical protein
VLLVWTFFFWRLYHADNHLAKTVACLWHSFLLALAVTAFVTALVTPAGFKPTSGAGGDGGWGRVGDCGGFQHGGLDGGVILMKELARFWHGVHYLNTFYLNTIYQLFNIRSICSSSGIGSGVISGKAGYKLRYMSQYISLVIIFLTPIQFFHTIVNV